MQVTTARGAGSSSSELSKARFVGAFCATSLLFARAAGAAEAPFAAPSAAADVASTASAGSLVQVTLSLLLVLAAVFAVAWLLRRLRNFGRPGAGAIEVIADVALGARERAVLVQVGDQQLLLGVAPGRVNTLHVLTQPVRTDMAPTSSMGSGANARPDFKAILKRSFGL